MCTLSSKYRAASAQRGVRPPEKMCPLFVVCVLSHTSSMCSLTYSIKMCLLLIVRALILVACVLCKWNVFSDPLYVSLYVSLTDSEHLKCVLSKLFVLSLILVACVLSK